MLEAEEKLKKILMSNHSILQELKLMRSLNLPHWYVAAGYIRNYVWDTLHHYPGRTPLNDVDILYYDRTDISVEAEKKYEEQMNRLSNKYRWSVKNQARMHLRNREHPYESVEDAMKRWPETATAVGVRIENNNSLSIIAPHGLDDLFGLKIRQSPFYTDRDYFFHRIKSKGWLQQWPRLEVVDR